MIHLRLAPPAPLCEQCGYRGWSEHPHERLPSLADRRIREDELDQIQRHLKRKLTAEESVVIASLDEMRPEQHTLFEALIRAPRDQRMSCVYLDAIMYKLATREWYELRKNLGLDQ